jgi:hypothetical protein
MPIPTETDRKLAELDDMAASIMVALRVLRFGGPSNDGRQVRERLQIFCDNVVELANELIANADVR